MMATLEAALLLFAGSLASGIAGPAQATASAGLVIRDAWVRESTATRTSSSGYFTIENRTDRPVALTRVSVDGAGDAQVHTSVEQQGQTVMRPLAAVQIPAHGSVDLAPGGTHVMLIDVAGPLRRGTTVEMTLTFDDGQVRKVRAVVRPLSAMSVR